MKEKKNSKILQVLIGLTIVALIAVLSIDILSNYFSFDDLFKATTKTITKKEVTVTDEGIADAVEKLYDATVIVKVGSSNKLTGWGSGFVYKTDKDKAYILTNHHVVDSSDYIEIEFSDGSTEIGKLLGSNEYSDVAVVTVPVNKIIAVAEIGESENLRVGDTVFAIGTPVSLDYSFTVTRGILSGKSRLVEMASSSNENDNTNPFKNFFSQNTQTVDTWYMSLLQIDASINSGNSGGPLANCNGEVVGITNSKLNSSYSSTSIENIGFAIPIEEALSVASEIESGHTSEKTKIVLGVSMTTVDGASEAGINLDESVKTGAVITQVIEDSNASRAGLKAGDVITEFNGNKIDDYRRLKFYLYKCKIGDKVKCKIIRDGKEKEIEITLKG